MDLFWLTESHIPVILRLLTLQNKVLKGVTIALMAGIHGIPVFLKLFPEQITGVLDVLTRIRRFPFLIENTMIAVIHLSLIKP